MNAFAHIDNTAVIKATKQLADFSKSGLPVAVRTALNSVAFDVKQRTMPMMAGQEFENRAPNFFKANSTVIMATGFDVGTMQSQVGFTEKNLKGVSNYAVKDLEQQEQGGNIGGRSLIPLTLARTGNSYKKAVRRMNRIENIKKVVDTNKIQGISRKQRFIKAALKAGEGGYVLGNFMNDRYLYRINSIRINRLSNKVDIKQTPLYDYKKNRKVKVNATHFMREASLKSVGKMEFFYMVEAQKQLKKLGWRG